MKKINVNLNPVNFFFKHVHLLILVLLIYIGLYMRLTTVNTKINLDYDPWWYYRHTKYLLDNNLQAPKWDILSYSPPGRPIIDPFGWEYIVAISYKIVSAFAKIDFMRYAIWIPAVFSALIAIPAYLTGRIITNRWGGLTTALFAVTTPALLGISMAGYMDTDALVVFFTFASAFSILYALEKRTIFSYVLATITLWIFAFSWAQSWYILDIFIAFLLIYFVGSIAFVIIKKIKNKGSGIGILKENWKNFKPYFKTIIIVTLASNLLTFASQFVDPFKNRISTLPQAFLNGLGFIEGELIVNVSIAELQPINILTRDGFLQVAARTGISIYFALFLPIIIFIKFKMKQKITFGEMAAIIWLLVTFYLILNGVRFSLLFMCATAAAGGFVVGNLVNFMGTWKGKGSSILYPTVLGIVVLLLFTELSTDLQYSFSMGGMEVDDNWIGMLNWLKDNADKNAIVSTWWDPGHIITGYTNLRVHADGAHCPANNCVPYNHNIRIQNMGRIMSTDDEKEAVDILKKYIGLTPEQCREVKQKFGDIVPKEACDPASEMYLISSNDLIGKFTWMDYFGGFRAPIASETDFMKNPGVCCASTPKTEAGQVSCGEFKDQGKGVWVWCPWIFSLSDVQQDQSGRPVYIYDYSGLKMALVQKDNQLIPIYNNNFMINHVTFFLNGKEQNIDLSETSTDLEKNDGLVWVDPSFRALLYFAPDIKDSVFVKTFFYDGRGLENFKLVYSNPEIKLYRVIFD